MGVSDSGQRDREPVKRRLGLETASLASARAPRPLSTSLKSDLPGHVPVHARGLYSLRALPPCTFHAEASAALFVVPGDSCPVSGVRLCHLPPDSPHPRPALPLAFLNRLGCFPALPAGVSCVPLLSPGCSLGFGSWPLLALCCYLLLPRLVCLFVCLFSVKP